MLDMADIGFFVYMTECEKEDQKEDPNCDPNLDQKSDQFSKINL